MKKFRLLLLPFLTFALSLASCNKGGGGNQNIEVTAVRLDQTTITLDEGSSKQLTATVEPEDATDKTVTWSSSNSAVATVNNGLVRGAKKGTAIITATAGDKNATCNVTVNEVVIKKALQALKVTPPNKTTYYVGDSLDLTGLKVIAVYTDRSEETLTSSQYEVTGFDSSAAVNNQTVTVSYTYERVTKTGTFSVTILEKVAPAPIVSSIAVTRNPTKAEYEIGEELDTTGMVVTATYSDGTTEVVTGYTLSGFSSERAGQVTVTVTFEGKSATFTVVIKEKPSIVTITGIEVATKPTKLSYEIGESLDTTGMVIKAVKSDDTKEEVTGWTTSGFSSETAGEKTVTVTWKDAANKGFTATFKVTVLAAPVLESIKVDASSAKTEYEYNEDLDTSGLVVTAKYDRGDDKTIAISDCEVTGYSKTTEGEQTITVTYEGKKDTYKVTVSEKAPELQSIILDTTNTKLAYEVGDNADFNGLVVKAHYDKGDDITLTSDQYEITGFDSSAAGTKTITVTYSNKTETFEITISDPVVPPTPSKTLSSIAVTTNPTKTTYYVGDELDKTGMVITATYSDDTTETIDNSLVTTDFDSSVVAAEKTVTVTYQEKTATFTVTIEEAPAVVPNYVMHHKLGASDWADTDLIVNPAQGKENERMLENPITLAVGDKFIFHLADDDWRGFASLKHEGNYENFKADGNNFEVTVAGDYQFYIDTNENGQIYVARILHNVSIEAVYADDYALLNGTVNAAALTVNYVRDDGSKLEISNEDYANLSFYVLGEQDAHVPVNPSTPLTKLGEMTVYVHLGDFADTSFSFEVIYAQYYVHYTEDDGNTWTNVEFHGGPNMDSYRSMSLTLHENAKFEIYDGLSKMAGSDKFTYLDSHISNTNGTYQVDKDGLYFIGLDSTNNGVLAYYNSWSLTVNDADPTLAGINGTPTQYEYIQVELAAGDVFTFTKDGVNFGYDGPNSFYKEKLGQDFFTSNSEGTKFEVKEGQGGIYSFYLKHGDYTYHTDGEDVVATPELYVVKEDIWHIKINENDSVINENPYNNLELSVIDVILNENDVLSFYNLITSSGYDNITENEQKAHFEKGTGANEGKLIVKDAGAYSFYLTRATGDLRVVYYDEDAQGGFKITSPYIVGSKDFSSGTSATGESWNDKNKALEMDRHAEDIPVGYDDQYKSQVHFAAGDEWKIRNNIYLEYVIEDNAGAFASNKMHVDGNTGNIVVDTEGSYEVYLKIKENGYMSLYVSEQIDFTLSKNTVTLHYNEQVEVTVAHIDGTGFETLIALLGSASIATAVADAENKKITVTAVAEGQTEYIVTDGKTYQSLNITVLPELMPTGGFGIQFDDNSFIAGVDAGEYDGFLQYRLENVHLEVGDKFNLVDFSNGARWVVNVDASSFSDAVATYLDKGETYYEVLEECYVDIYIKLKQGQDQIYFGLYDIMLNGVRDNANESIENGDEGFVTASMWTGTLSASVTEGADKVEIVSVDQNTGKITFRGIGVGDATITVSANGFERTVSVTVSLTAKAYIAGIDNNWTAGQESYKLTKVGDGHYQITGVEIQQGDQIKIVYTVDDGANYAWYGNDSTWQAVEEIIERKDNGNVEFLQDGTYTIDFYVSADGNNHIVPAKTGELTSLYVDSTQKNVEAGNTVTITATHFIGTLSAVSDNESYATIANIDQQTGVITVNGVADGTANITVSSTGNPNTKVVSVEVAPIHMVTITLKSSKDVGSGNRLYFVGEFSNWKINANAIVFQYVTDHWEATFEIVEGTTYTGKLVIGAWENPAADPTGWEGGGNRDLVFDEDKTITLNWQ